MRLHPDIERIEALAGRKTVKVIDPSPGIWGGDPVPGLVTVVYECPEGDLAPCAYATSDRTPHTHHALYGPPMRAECGQPHVGCNHKLVVIPGAEGMELYAD